MTAAPQKKTPAPGRSATSEPPASNLAEPETAPRLHEMSALPEIEQSTEPESQWLPSQQQQTFREKQREDFQLHRTLRREGEWHDKWTDADAKKYERMRRNVEYKIAKNLRPDKYMIVDRTAKMSDTLESDYPFASIHDESTVFHTSRYRSRIPGGSSDMIASLQSN